MEVRYLSSVRFLPERMCSLKSLAIFNLIPIPPLDGSRILYPIAPEFVQDFFDKLESYGPIFILMIMFLFSTVISNYISVCMSFTLEGFAALLRLFGL